MTAYKATKLIGTPAYRHTGIARPFGPQACVTVDYSAYWDNTRENVHTKTKACLGRALNR